MKKVLLIIANDKVRQLYHEILSSRQLEVVPTTGISVAIMLLSMDKFDLVILDASQNSIETEIFLRLRQKTPNLSKIKFIIISDDNDFNPQIHKKDLLIHTSKITTKTIVDQVENLSNF